MTNGNNYYIEIAESAKKFIELNIEKDISPDDAARAANYSLKHFNRIFYMATGLTAGEYIRWYKLTQALFELKYTNMPIIDIAFKYGYESQEAFTRAFKDAFSVNPGNYRKRKKEAAGKNRHIAKLIREKEHEYYYRKGIYTRENVESWIVTKPNRIWASVKRNVENLPVGEFYALCKREGLMQKASAVPGEIITGGAYLPTELYNREKFQLYLQAKAGGGKSNGWKWFRKWELSFGVEVEENYSLELLQGFEVFHISESQYVVFHCSNYSADKQDSIIESAWNAQKDYDVTANGLKWAYDTLPYFEAEDKETGYTLWFPVSERK